MKIQEVITYLESIAPPSLQESYDNAGLLTGAPDWECTGMMCTLDARKKLFRKLSISNCNLILAHHPIIFTGLKKINGKNYVERAVIQAIKNDVAMFAIHTNLDNILTGVNGKMADILGLINRKVLSSKPSSLKKLFTFVPVDILKAFEKLFLMPAQAISEIIVNAALPSKAWELSKAMTIPIHL